MLFRILAIVVLSSWGASAPGQHLLTEPKDDDFYSYKDNYNRDTPRGSLTGFFQACDERDYETAALYLDLRAIKKSEQKTKGPILAKKLKFVLDRALDLDEMHLADEPEGVTKDGLAKSRDFIALLELEKKKYRIYMDRMWGPKANVWKFSKSTVKIINPLYTHFGHGKIGEWLPPIFIEYEIFSLQLWQLIVILAFFPLIVGLSRFISRRMIRIMPHIGKGIAEFPEEKQLLRELEAPVLMFTSVILFTLLTFSLNLTIAAQKTILAGLATFLVISLTWFFLRSVDLFSDLFQGKLERRELIAASSMVPLGRRFTKIFLFVITALALLRVYNIDITALLAGLGVGGIAVALAAQKSLENLFSGVALITDQPVRVGDFCRFDQQLGRVEDIGIRSTRIRTLERSVITIPNREFSQMKLENLSLRDKIQFQTMIGVRYETTTDQLRYILSQLRQLLLSHPKVLQDRRIRVRFIGFGEYSLNIDVFCHINTRKWYDFLAIQEDLMLRIMEIVEACGTGFAFPSRTVYQDSSSSLPQEKVAHAQNEIARLRQDGGLPFPDYTPEQYNDFRATLSYPPDGSISRPKQTHTKDSP
ncbi:mechanosensitive ion channel family protein [Pseudobacteriovorax antillogorgiicola]|uniref:MscS family membrane protein n=1 Tax=Pseudobacteriovorax antillogorgiicola TaxID=1513793 RepID=A0A1Y6CQ74_9BACT|nr:mechanosensitive ion channel family protein [Pseudobacteriovorax antillogorgiicola]TCS46179.1 MscS family membrane protein [Pseudobacteriovorax antillogorgiicola]SMF70031.1 MscS family membrane protein [Pseudobacteriovorax antillogorgiicola]